jgi:hypothetical protein
MAASVKRKFARVAMVVFCLLLPFAVWRLRLRHDVDNRLAAICSVGLPTHGEELNRWSAAVPERENGRDDAGREKPEGTSSAGKKTYDLAFTLER